jgi:UDP-N-acetylglucosamine--N-acetylmuramyl-(pentapeptide) pyrophosphoryl-undecaprenol N-acetylglucosamine transferase
MTRIAYFVHGRGKGHAVRTKAVLERLRSSVALRVFCAGPAFDILRDHPASEEVLTYAPGCGIATMGRSFALRLQADRRRLRDWRPSVVASDGDGPSVTAAWSLGIPVLAIGHGLIFRHTHLKAPLALLKRVRETINAGSSSWPAARRIAVHFAPVEAATPGTHVVRPDLRISVEPNRPRESFILAYFRDDNGMEAVRRLSSRGHRVVLFGRPATAPRGVEVREPEVGAFAEVLARCAAVVGSAGNQLPAECAMLGVPMLALHRRHDPEHQMNARLIEAAGIGIGCAFERLDQGLIRRFEAELDKDRSGLAARTRAMRPASEVVPRVIDELCEPRPVTSVPRPLRVAER